MIIVSAESAGINRIMEVLACPQCRGRLRCAETRLACENCGESYEITKGIPDLRPRSAEPRREGIEWTEHWSTENQRSLSQRFFSFYRRTVFARAVSYFVDRYLPPRGILIEAGSGTSETSMFIKKRNGERTLVAIDLIRPVLERCHSIMDVRVCGDIFSLPFQDDSIDGIWNVGVMEHFEFDRIDAILGEFRRVLKPRERAVLLWPATFSVPQRMLRVVEWFINLRRGRDKFRFHPDEISQLRSAEQGRRILARNGFRPVAVDLGLRTLMAFETLVGEKDPILKSCVK